MLEVNHVSYAFAETTIRAHFQVEPGKCLALMGPSGCGKTTILDLIAGFRTPHGGDIRYQGKNLIGLEPAKRPLSYLFQQHNLLPHLTVWQNIGLGIHPGLKMNAQDRAQIAWALSSVGLVGFEQRKPSELSGGQQQRVGLGRCLVRKRPLLLLDEPFSALDQDIRSNIMQLILTLQANHPFTLILSTHQESDAQALGARIYRFDTAR